MIFLTDYIHPYMVDSLNEPMVAEYFWCFSGPMMDSTLIPITYLEETTVPAVVLDIDGSQITIPTSWNILVTDSETSSLDSIPPQNCAIHDYSIIGFSGIDDKLRKMSVRAIGYEETSVFYHPMIPKGCMMWHPIQQCQKSKHKNIISMCIGPYDLYSKYISNKVIGDLIF